MPSWCPHSPRLSSAPHRSIDERSIIGPSDAHCMNERAIKSNNAPMLSPGSSGFRSEAEKGRIKREMLRCQSTPEGDVRTFVSDPSFDTDERQTGARSVDSRGSREGARDDSKPSPEDAGTFATKNGDGIGRPAERRHSQHLSAHFNSATKIYDDSVPPEKAETSVIAPSVSADNKSISERTKAEASNPLQDQNIVQQGGVNTGAVQSMGAGTGRDATVEAAVPGGEQPDDLPRRSPVAFESLNPDAFIDTPSIALMKTELLPSPNSSQLAAAQLTSPNLKRSPGVGQKHRRGVSSGFTNPNFAHRRMNSGGNAAPVKRKPRGPIPQLNSQMPPPMPARSGKASHQRENSAGLSIGMLTAAANASKEVLAEAAGVPRRSPRSSPRSYGRHSSPVASGSVTYGRGSPSVLQQPQLCGPEGSIPETAGTEDRCNETGRPSTQFRAPAVPLAAGYQYYEGGTNSQQHPPAAPPQHPPAPLQHQGPPPPTYPHENYQQPAQQHYYQQPPPPQSGYYPPPRASAVTMSANTGPPPPPHHSAYYPPPRPTSSAVHSSGPPPYYPVQYAPPRRSFALEEEEQQYSSTRSSRKPPPSRGGVCYGSQRTPPPDAQAGTRPSHPSHERQMAQASAGSMDRIDTDEALFTNNGAMPTPAGWNGSPEGVAAAQPHVAENNRHLPHPRSGAPQPATAQDGRPPPVPASAAQQPQLYSDPELAAPAPVPVAAPHHHKQSSIAAFVQTLTELETSDNFLRQLNSSNPSPTYQATAPSAPAQYAAPPPQHQATSDPGHYVAPPPQPQAYSAPAQYVAPPPQPQATSDPGQYVAPPPQAYSAPAQYAAPPPQPQMPSAPAQYAEPPPQPQAHPGSVQPMPQDQICQEIGQPGLEGKPGVGAQAPATDASRRYTTSKNSKRVRRKCTAGDCSNRVVQGGLCIAHGAKRKLCGLPGCQKNVKKAGLCSTHGPSRKRCEQAGCNKVAVQGGVCIAHGARKKLCSVEKCAKQAILGGMCKKHHDQTHGIVSGRIGRTSGPSNNAGTALCGNSSLGAVISGQAKVAPADAHPDASKPGHQRGLSIFQEMGAVATIIGEDGLADAGVPLAPPQVENRGAGLPTNAAVAPAQHESSGDRVYGPQPPASGGGKQGKNRSKGHNRGLSFFSDENVADSIIENNII